MAADLATLTKLRIASASTLTAAGGYLACARRPTAALLPLLLGTLMLAMGASALNQVQEREHDARMPRTAGRPLPAGRMRPAFALVFALSLAAGGGLLIGRFNGWLPAALGLLAMAWYNAVYTPLKRRSPWAALPGSLIGALPPLMGWSAAGGRWGLPAATLAAVYFIWQMPHFWLLLFRQGEAYEGAGFPSLSRRLGARRLARLVWVLLAATALSALLLAWTGPLRSLWAPWVLGGAALGLLLPTAKLLRPEPGKGEPEEGIYRRAFLLVNLFGLLTTLVLMLEPLTN